VQIVDNRFLLQALLLAVFVIFSLQLKSSLYFDVALSIPCGFLIASTMFGGEFFMSLLRLR
jgi:hypothetical protein